MSTGPTLTSRLSKAVPSNNGNSTSPGLRPVSPTRRPVENPVTTTVTSKLKPLDTTSKTATSVLSKLLEANTEAALQRKQKAEFSTNDAHVSPVRDFSTKISLVQTDNRLPKAAITSPALRRISDMYNVLENRLNEKLEGRRNEKKESKSPEKKSKGKSSPKSSPKRTRKSK